jgi:hypothetical protein
MLLIVFPMYLLYLKPDTWKGREMRGISYFYWLITLMTAYLVSILISEAVLFKNAGLISNVIIWVILFLLLWFQSLFDWINEKDIKDSAAGSIKLFIPALILANLFNIFVFWNNSADPALCAAAFAADNTSPSATQTALCENMYLYAAVDSIFIAAIFFYGALPFAREPGVALGVAYSMTVGLGVWFILMAYFVFSSSSLAFAVNSAVGYNFVTILGGPIVLMVFPSLLSILYAYCRKDAKDVTGKWLENRWNPSHLIRPFMEDSKLRSSGRVGPKQ